MKQRISEILVYQLSEDKSNIIVNDTHIS